MKLIIGLGNPGKPYVGTRHNTGFEAVNRLAKELDATWSKDEKRHAEISRQDDVIIAKPTTFMNESGQAVQSLASYYKVGLEDLLIIQDEMDLPPGRIAFLAQGGAAGHNGIEDIQEKMGNKEICRLRIGIGRPTSAQTKESWVLGKAMDDEREAWEKGVEKAGQAIQDWIRDGLAKAMNRWNTSVPGTLG